MNSIGLRNYCPCSHSYWYHNNTAHESSSSTCICVQSDEVYLSLPISHINVSSLGPAWSRTEGADSCCTAYLLHKRAYNLFTACAWRAAKYIPNCCPMLFVTSVEKKANLTVHCSTFQGYRGLIWEEIRRQPCLIIHDEISLHIASQRKHRAVKLYNCERCQGSVMGFSICAISRE